MESLGLSADFTIEDIHKIRESNYEITKNMTVEEKVAYYNTPRTNAIEEIEKRRKQRLTN